MPKSKPASPLRQRMIDDMKLRKLSSHTQEAYISVVRQFARFLGRSPDTATAEDLRRYQLHLTERGAASATVNMAVCGLRFFFSVTVDRPDLLKHTSYVRKPRKLPEVLSADEVARLLKAAGSLKHRAALGVAYGAGLRASEVVRLTVTDIDSRRMVIRVNQGKGQRDRYAMLSPALLTLLRAWWREGLDQRAVLRGGWLFPGQPLVNPLSTRQLERVFHRALEGAGIHKRVSLHGLRHAFATHLLERHADIRVIQVLLGHQKLESTARYTHLATHTLRDVKGPLEYLDMTATA
jgi:integrase/recombinase XerD